MRKLFLALGAMAAVGVALPLITSAQAEDSTVVIKQGDRDHHRGMERRHEKMMVRHHHRHHDTITTNGQAH